MSDRRGLPVFAELALTTPAPCRAQRSRAHLLAPVLSLLGKPTLAGVEPCTNDGVLLNCSKLNVRKELADRHLRGVTETEVAHGVLAELQLEGFVVRAMPAGAPPPTPDREAVSHQAALADCHARQHEATVAAGQEKEPYKHTALVRAIPHCEDDPPVLKR